VALVLGFYQAFIDALAEGLRSLRSLHTAAGRQAFLRSAAFLIPLIIGAGMALVIGVKLLVGEVPKDLADKTGAELQAAIDGLEGLLVHPASAPFVFATFFGLVAASISEPWRAKKGHKGIDVVLLLVGAVVAASLALAPPAAGTTATWALVGAGAVAISVMLLPGVSGSLALLVLGMYQPVSAAAHDRDVGILAWFFLGVIAGAALMVPLLRRLLAVAHDRTMSLLSGLMLGSLVALWPWKAHYLPKLIPTLGPMSPQAPSGAWWLPVLCALAGAALVIVVSLLARRNASEPTPS
jgi:putative membrane protein